MPSSSSATPGFDPAALRAARLAAGLSRTQVAAAIGRSFHTVAHYERGLARPSAEALDRLVDVLGCDPADLGAPPRPRPDGPPAVPPEVTGEFPPAAEA